MTKHVKNPLQRLIAMLLCVVMVVGFMPVAANAAEANDVGAVALDTQSEDENIHLNKKVTTETDGSHTIELEAYAWGEVEDYVKPVDMVLVLDQSASMYTPMGLPEYITHDQRYDPSTLGSSVVSYTNAEFKEKYNDPTPDAAGFTFADKVHQLGYFIAQSVGGSNAYSGINECTHGDVDGDEIEGGIYIRTNAAGVKSKGNKDDGDCKKFLEKRANGETVTGNCYFTYDWFVVHYDVTDIKTPWHFYRVDDTTTPSKDSQVVGVDGVTSRVPSIMKYATIDDFHKFTFYVSQYGALFDAITSFAKGLHDSNADHRLAVAGFANGTYSTAYREGSGIYVDGVYTLYSPNYVDPENPNRTPSGIPKGEDVYEVDQIPAATYKSALVSVKSNYDSVIKSIRAVRSDYYGTFQDVGFDIALKTLNNATPVDTDLAEVGREKIVVLFTDGVPSGTTKELVVKKAAELKAAGYTVYTICTSTLADENIDFMKYSSSDYPDAKNMAEIGDQIDTPTYFKRVTNAEDMVQEFMSIVSDVGGTTVTYSKEAVLQDTIAKEFALPDELIADWEAAEDKEACLKEHVGVYTADYKGNSQFDTPVEFDDAKLAMVKNEDGSYSIQVSNFDYAANFISENGRGDQQDFYGKKLIVTIKGVKATDAAFTGEPICTNGTNSGLYTEIGLTVPFGMPMTKLVRKTYVMDYAKPITISIAEWTKDMVSMSDQPILAPEQRIVETPYGKFEKVDEHSITFTPNNMDWDGEAAFYALGDWLEIPEGVTTGENQWTKVRVVPANNIYYEDDFTTTESTGETGGRVGIVYSGDWSETPSAGNTETPEGAAGDADGVHGWEDSLADDTGYSDGSGHWADASDQTESATATFTFTGEGVDIYGRTTPTTGTVYGTLKGTDENGTSISKRLIVDTVSESGDYYQIPTLSFMDLPYGTYTVTIKVTKGAESENRFIYYLDGIRVYNPMQDQSGYAPEEQHAIFKEVRDMLLDAESFGEVTEDETSVAGAVFIDAVYDDQAGEGTEAGTPTTTTNVVGIYKDYGPKNEVYLAKGQSITFKVGNSADRYYYIGLKAPNINSEGENGGTATALVSSNGTVQKLTISHSTDLYYEVKPDTGGYITIRNDGKGLLSVTKLRVTGNTATGTGLLSITDEEALEAVNAFSARPAVNPAFPNVVINNPTDSENPGANSPATMLLKRMMMRLFTGLSDWFD